MTHSYPTCSAEADAAIDRLLVTAEPVSIVDGLFELVDGDRVVRDRLQARLAERMKRTIAARDGG